MLLDSKIWVLFLSPLLPSLRCRYCRDGSPPFMDSGKTGLKEGSNPSKVTHQDRLGWSLGPLPERSISSALNPCQQCGLGWGQDKTKQEPPGTSGWLGEMRGSPCNGLGHLRVSPRVPPLATLPSQHALGSACPQPPTVPGDLGARGPFLTKGQQRGLVPALPPLSSLAGIHKGFPREGSTGRSIVQP